MICLAPTLRVPSCKHHAIHTQFRLAYLDQTDSYKNLEISVILALVQSCSAHTWHFWPGNFISVDTYLLWGLWRHAVLSNRGPKPCPQCLGKIYSLVGKKNQNKNQHKPKEQFLILLCYQINLTVQAPPVLLTLWCILFSERRCESNSSSKQAKASKFTPCSLCWRTHKASQYQPCCITFMTLQGNL